MLKNEAFQLSKVPFSVPYMKPMVEDRLKDYRKALAQRITRSQYEKIIRDTYDKMGWIDSKGNYSPWSMLRDYQDRYRDKHPSYDSPWEKQRKSMKDFVKTLEKQLAKLPERAPMTEATRRNIAKQQAEAAEHFKHIEKRRKEIGY